MPPHTLLLHNSTHSLHHGRHVDERPFSCSFYHPMFSSFYVFIWFFHELDLFRGFYKWLGDVASGTWALNLVVRPQIWSLLFFPITAFSVCLHGIYFKRPFEFLLLKCHLRKTTGFWPIRCAISP